MLGQLTGKILILSLVALQFVPMAVRARPPANATRDSGSPMAVQVDEGPVFDLLLGGARQRVLLRVPPDARGTIVMLPGGAGQLGLERDGRFRHGANFVVRTRNLWLGHGYAVVIADAIDGTMLRGVRASSRYAAVVNALVAFAHAHVPGPVFLLGTSQGSIAAMNGAAHAPAGVLAGIVLTESVSVMGGSRETVFSAAPRLVRVPVLIVANRDDRCIVAPPDAAPHIAAALSSSPDVQVLTISGGLKGAMLHCDSLTPHGYYGIETSVVDAISRWMDGHR